MVDKQPVAGPLSVEEYLAREEESPRRHEYVAGRVYAMSGTTARHNAIAGNIFACLRAAARGGACTAYLIDIKVRAAPDRFYYPDCVVVCTPHAGDTLTFDDPCLVTEVASRSTRRTDRGEKLDAYLAMPSLRAYLIAEQDRRQVTLYTRDASGWTREEAVVTGNLTLPCPASTVSLDEIYEGVELPPLKVGETDADEDWAEFRVIGLTG